MFLWLCLCCASLCVPLCHPMGNPLKETWSDITGDISRKLAPQSANLPTHIYTDNTHHNTCTLCCRTSRPYMAISAQGPCGHLDRVQSSYYIYTKKSEFHCLLIQLIFNSFLVYNVSFLQRWTAWGSVRQGEGWPPLHLQHRILPQIQREKDRYGVQYSIQYYQ